MAEIGVLPCCEKGPRDEVNKGFNLGRRPLGSRLSFMTTDPARSASMVRSLSIYAHGTDADATYPLQVTKVD